MIARQVAVIGGGWAGMAAAVAATQAGHQVTVLEATRQWGGRARALDSTLADGSHAVLDNGQHILIGAYSHTLDLMRTVGVDPQRALLRLPLRMLFPDGQGLRLPDWPMPLDVLAGIWTARGWSAADKWSLLRNTSRWQMAGFRCAPQLSVAQLCQGMTPVLMQTLIEPLCVSALNTPPERASAAVFLRVLKDSLLGGKGSSNLLIPTTDMASLFPAAAARWLEQRGASLQAGSRVTDIRHQSQWQVNGQAFDAVVLACPASTACQLLDAATADTGTLRALRSWTARAGALEYESIATVYVQAGATRLEQPLLALRSSPAHPAQFVFDRGRLGGPAGLLAFVVSASQDARVVLQHKVLQQAVTQLGLQDTDLHVVQTVVEKRATFACTPGLQRPSTTIAAGLLACGDYIDGPYPATLEGAVRSGTAAARALVWPT